MSRKVPGKPVSRKYGLNININFLGMHSAYKSLVPDGDSTGNYYFYFHNETTERAEIISFCRSKIVKVLQESEYS